jgi:hypothetical protein
MDGPARASRTGPFSRADGRTIVLEFARLTAQPDLALTELRDAPPTTVSTLWLEIDRLGLRKTAHADEQRRPDVAVARRQMAGHLFPSMRPMASREPLKGSMC